MGKKNNTEFNVSAHTGEDRIFRLFINGTLHVHFPIKYYRTMQSYKERDDWFCIEYYLKDKVVLLSEYNSRKKWQAVLDAVNTHLRID